MPPQTPRIEIPKKDLWTVLFERESKPFPDSQGQFIISGQAMDITSRPGTGRTHLPVILSLTQLKTTTTTAKGTK